MRLEIIIAGGETEMNVIDEKIIEEALNKYGWKYNKKLNRIEGI